MAKPIEAAKKIMSKKNLVLLLALLTINALVAPVAAQTVTQTSAAQNIKARVAKFGIGEKARVKVTLRDKTKLQGYISEAGETDFRLRDSKTGAATNVPYANVSRVEKKGFSTLAKVGIGVGIGVAAYVVVIAVITKGFTKRILD